MRKLYMTLTPQPEFDPDEGAGALLLMIAGCVVFLVVIVALSIFCRC